jgi:micrococcal nuclease
MRSFLTVFGRRIKKWFTATILLLLAAPLGAEGFRGRVVGISDGDTISVMHEGRAERVRLHGIDAPEKGQPFTNRAKQYVSDLVFGKDVKVEVHGQDRYGRTIGDVFLPDGRNLNHEIVKAGFAWWFRRYAPHNRVLEKLESEAREAKRGLWVDANPVPPWEFRRGLRSAAKIQNAGQSVRRQISNTTILSFLWWSQPKKHNGRKAV